MQNRENRKSFAVYSIAMACVVDSLHTYEHSCDRILTYHDTNNYYARLFNKHRLFANSY